MAARETPTAHSIVYRAVVIVKQCIAAKLIMEGSRWSGRIEARSGLRMMPTFPRSPLSFACSRASMPTWPSPFDHRLGTPKIPAIRSTRASHFVASLVRFRYGLPGCSPPCTDQTGTPQPSGTFTSRLSTDRSPSPPLDITTTATGLLCWRDSHPLEWQLASLHGQNEKPPFSGLCQLRPAADIRSHRLRTG